MIPEGSIIDQAETEAELLARAEAAAAQQDVDTALAAWAAVRERFPHNPRAWLRAGDLLLARQRPDAADDLLDDGRRRFPQEFWIARGWARVAVMQGDVTEAFTRTRAVRYAFPYEPVARSDLALVLLDRGNSGAAETEAAAGLAIFPDFLWLWSVYAQCAGAAGDNTVAAARWSELLVRHPMHQAGYAPAVRALAACGRNEEAAGLAGAGLALFPELAALREALATVGLPAAAADSDGASPDSDIAQVVADRAEQAEHANDHAGAAALWASYRDAMPASPAGYAGGARAALGLGRFAEAECLLTYARHNLPAHEAVSAAWAKVAMQRQDLEEALRRFRTLRREFPQALAWRAGEARALLGLGRATEAEATLADAAEVIRGSPDLLICFAEAASARGEWEEAVRRWSDVWATGPDGPDSYLRLAEALQHAGNAARADAILTDATARFPEDATAAERWAEAANADSHSQPSIDRWSNLTQRFPERAAYWLTRAERLQAARRGSEAAAVLAEAADRFPDDPEVQRRRRVTAEPRRAVSTDVASTLSNGTEAQANPPARIALAIAASPYTFYQVRDLVRSLVTHAAPGTCPPLFISATNDADCATLLGLLDEIPGNAPVSRRIVSRHGAALDEALPDVTRLEVGLAEGRSRLTANYQRMHVIGAAFADGYDTVAALSHRCRMFRPTDLGAALRQAAAAHTFRYRTKTPAASPAARIHAMSVRSVWPAGTAESFVVRANGTRDNIRLYRRDEFAGFADRMMQTGSVHWHARVSESLRNETAFQLASRLFPGADDWAAYMAWTLTSAACPYRLVPLDDMADLLDVSPDAGLWTQVRSAGFDRRVLLGAAPPFVPPTTDAALLTMVEECLPSSVCLMIPEDCEA